MPNGVTKCDDRGKKWRNVGSLRRGREWMREFGSARVERIIGSQRILLGKDSSQGKTA